MELIQNMNTFKFDFIVRNKVKTLNNININHLTQFCFFHFISFLIVFKLNIPRDPIRLFN